MLEDSVWTASEVKGADVATAGVGNSRSGSLEGGFKYGTLIPLDVFIVFLGWFWVVWAKKKEKICTLWRYPTCKPM